MHPTGLELTKLTYTRLEDNLIRHRGDRPSTHLDPNSSEGTILAWQYDYY